MKGRLQTAMRCDAAVLLPFRREVLTLRAP